MKITEKVMQMGMSSNGSWSRAQLALLNVPLPLATGWKKALIGSEVDNFAVCHFIRLRDAHLQQAQTHSPVKVPSQSSKWIMGCNYVETKCDCLPWDGCENCTFDKTEFVLTAEQRHIREIYRL